MIMIIIMMIMIINKEMNCSILCGCSINAVIRFASNHDSWSDILSSQPFHMQQTTSDLDHLIKNMNTESVCI